MPKKTKRQTRREMLEMGGAQTVAGTSRAGGNNISSDFNPDYSYITRDLRRIGILAGSFFAILIVLSFFIK